MSVDQLTPHQLAAVKHRDGALLVLAGPGSGKTRVITHRIASLVQNGVPDRNILAITFTNKAANEMKERVSQLLPGHRVWLGTFHKFCARLLRRYATCVGLQPNYTIMDTTDQHRLLRQVLHELDIDAVHTPPAKVATRISKAKTDLLGPDTFARKMEHSIGDHTNAIVAQVYQAYQDWLLKSNAVDFDDLLLHTVHLLSENEELRRQLDDYYHYVLVDEYQDTNLAQYRIVTALTRNSANVCVTGDPDQSIYGWRGAQIENILRFEADYPNATVVRLEHNFRSTGHILDAADRLIVHNRHRKAKSLIATHADGPPVELLRFRDGRCEADFMARQIRAYAESGQGKWSDIAVLYRVTSLSREIELALTRYHVPYQVAAGVAFYERAEIKDLIAYLRLIENPNDTAAFQRVVNTPTRGIGKKTQTRVTAWAKTKGLTLMEAARQADDVTGLGTRAKKALKAFARLMSDFDLAEAGSVERLLEIIVDRTGYTRAWQDSQSEQDLSRLANVNELMTAAAQYDREADGESALEGFLEAASLATEIDRLDESAGKVTLMTLHASKGLEFPVVYIVAVEHGILPHERSLRSENPRSIEEERRLLFVGMTRAMRQLRLTETIEREIHGRPLHSIRSDFLFEIQVEPIDCTVVEPKLANGWMSESTDTPSEVNETALKRLRSEKRPTLTTGAALLNGVHQSVDVPQGFAVGMRVRHPRYGVGTVTALSGFSKHRIVQVEFTEGNRTETFVASKCPLQPVGIQ